MLIRKKSKYCVRFWIKCFPAYLTAIGIFLTGIGACLGLYNADKVFDKLTDLEKKSQKIDEMLVKLDSKLDKIEKYVTHEAKNIAANPIMKDANASPEEIAKVLDQIPTSPLLAQHRIKNEIVASAEFPAKPSDNIAIYLPPSKRDKLIEQLQKARPSEREEIIRNALEYSTSF